MKIVDYAIAIFIGLLSFMIGTTVVTHLHLQRPFVWGLLAGIVGYLVMWHLLLPDMPKDIPRVPETTLPDDWEGA